MVLSVAVYLLMGVIFNEKNQSRQGLTRSEAGLSFAENAGCWFAGS